MSMTTELDFNSGNVEGMVNMGTHRAYLRGAGPTRTGGTPVVIIEAGLESSSLGWIAVERAISQFARVYSYDRAGLGKSESSPRPRSATVIAEELHALLQAAHIESPYVFVAHSYAGVLTREFLAAYNEEVAGMVFVDANQERSYIDRNWPEKEFGRILGSLDFFEVTGLTSSHALTKDEWATFVGQVGGVTEDTATESKKEDHGTADSGGPTTGTEKSHCASSMDVLGRKRQLDEQALGKRPVSVIFANAAEHMRRVLVAGEAAGNGSDEDRAIMHSFLARAAGIEERLQRDQLRLSSNNHFVHTLKSGHLVQLTEPQLIADEVRWVYEHQRNK